MQIRSACLEDAERISQIYNYYISNTVVTFEEDSVSSDVMKGRIASVKESGLPWLVLEIEGRVVGYAYATKWKERSAYRYSVESTVYVDYDFLASGYGLKLYEALIECLRVLKVNAVIGGVSLPNDASVSLHERLGFRHVGVFSEVGRKFDKWVDVGYWLLKLAH